MIVTDEDGTELVTVQQIEALDETGWSDAVRSWARIVLAGILGEARRIVPQLADPDFTGRDEARLIIIRAVQREIAGDARNPTQRSHSEGPFSDSATFVDRAALPSLTRGDRDQLRSLRPNRRRRPRTIMVRPVR